MSKFDTFKMMRFIEGYHSKYKAAEHFLYDEDFVPYKDILPLNDLYGYVTDDGVQGLWRDMHSFSSDDTIYEYHNNKMIREFKYFRGTKDVHHEINFDEKGGWATEVVYYPNGQEKIVKPWSRGNLQGEVIEYYSNGEIKSRKTYEKGTLVTQNEYDNDYADDEEEE